MSNQGKSKLGLDKIFEKNGISLKTLNEVLENNEINSIIEVDVKSLIPNRFQPRLKFDEVKLKELAESIKKHGIITPIIVRHAGEGQFEIVAGERRSKASELAQKDTIPAIVADFSDKQMMQLSLIENIQREDLTSIEEARSYNEMKTVLNLTQAQLAKEVGKPRSHIANLLRLLTLPFVIQNYILEGKISTGHAKVLVGLEDKEAVEFANRIIRENLSVREVEHLLQTQQTTKKPTKKSNKTNKTFVELEGVLKDKYHHNKIYVSEKEIKIKFKNSEELKEFVKKM